MPKEILVDPKLHRRAGTLSFADIPIHSYATPLDHERKRHGDARLGELLRAMLVVREFETMLAAFKARRNQAGLERALEAVRGAAGGGANSVPVVRDAVRAGATSGEICAVWRESFGEWQPYARRLA